MDGHKNAGTPERRCQQIIMEEVACIFSTLRSPPAIEAVKGVMMIMMMTEILKKEFSPILLFINGTNMAMNLKFYTL